MILTFPRLEPNTASLRGEELAEQIHLPEYHSENTDAALAGTGITCPPMNRIMIDSYMSYFSSLGYFTKPTINDRVRSLFVR